MSDAVLRKKRSHVPVAPGQTVWGLQRPNASALRCEDLCARRFCCRPDPRFGRRPRRTMSGKIASMSSRKRHAPLRRFWTSASRRSTRGCARSRGSTRRSTTAWRSSWTSLGSTCRNAHSTSTSWQRASVLASMHSRRACTETRRRCGCTMTPFAMLLSPSIRLAQRSRQP